MQMKIGDVAIEGNLILAPMAGVTDAPFRALCKEQGASLAYTEMVSAKALHYRNKNTEPLLKIWENEGPVALQLFGNDPELMAEEALKLEEGPYDIFDINMGCPVPKVVNNGEGSALMKDPALVEKIILAMTKALHKPVTVKIRKGFDNGSINAVEIAKIAEGSGAAAVAVHGRTREEYYHGAADYGIIRQVKEAVKIPVMGSGDIYAPEDAKRMLGETGADGVMVARGARGNPWIFSRTKEYLAGGSYPERPEIEEVKKTILLQLDMLIRFMETIDLERRRGSDRKRLTKEEAAVRQMRAHVGWYSQGYPSSAALRRGINRAESFDEFVGIIKGWK